MNNAGGANRLDGVQIAYARESWTTAVHLEAALSRVTAVDAFGPGHPNTVGAVRPRGHPLIWVEARLPWLPGVDDLVEPPTVAWLIDTHRAWRWRAEVARAFTTVFVAQRDAVSLFETAGVRAEWLPLAAPAGLCGPGPDLAERPFDLALVGQAPPGSLRARLLTALGGQFKVAPSAGRMDPSEMMDVYRSARIVINPPLANDLNMRAFEALGARALLVTGPMYASHELLGDLPIVVDSRDPAKWEGAIAAALSDPQAQVRADSGFEVVLARHTYDHRASFLLNALSGDELRPPDHRSLTRALAHGYARWGQVRQAWALSHDVRLGLTAAGWAAAVAVKQRLPVLEERLRLYGERRAGA